MKKILTNLLITILCFLLFAGCGRADQENNGQPLLPSKDGVIGIEVSSLPETESYSFSGDDADKIIDYLSGLNLTSYSEDDVYYGMTWVIAVEYENGDVVTVYHFGNFLIRADNGPWYEMKYREAEQFDALLEKLND